MRHPDPVITRTLASLRGADPVLRIAPRPDAAATATSSLWFEQAMAHETGAIGAETPVPASADVVVVGGGFTGLWTALALKRRRPGTEVVLLEADLCGSGASGRNGGFILTSWSKFASLRKACGEADALAYATAVADGVAAIAAFCEEHAIEALIRREGWLWAATNDAQNDAWSGVLRAARRSRGAALRAPGPRRGAGDDRARRYTAAACWIPRRGGAARAAGARAWPAWPARPESPSVSTPPCTPSRPGSGRP